MGKSDSGSPPARKTLKPNAGLQLISRGRKSRPGSLRDDNSPALALQVEISFDSLSLWERVGLGPERKLQQQVAAGFSPPGFLRKHQQRRRIDQRDSSR